MDKPEDINDLAINAARPYAEELRGAMELALKGAGAEWRSVDLQVAFVTNIIAIAILSAQSQAYIDAARIAEKHAGVNMADNARFVARNISAAILQRKEEIGR